MIVCNVQELGDRDTVTVLSLPPKMCNYLLHIPGVGAGQGEDRRHHRVLCPQLQCRQNRKIFVMVSN